MRKTATLGNQPELGFYAGADAGTTWHLVIFANNDKVLDRLIEGTPWNRNGAQPVRRWEHIDVDLTRYKNQTIVLRLYDLVLVPHRYAGNSYWKDLALRKQ